MTALLRTLCAAVIMTPTFVAGAQPASESYQIELQDLRKELRYELDALKKEVDALKVVQAELGTGYADLAKKVDDPQEPKPAPRPGQPDQEAVYAMPVEGSAILGAADAWVTIVEVSDFQCPFCQRVQPTLSKLKDEYKGDVRFVFKHLPLSFHNRARAAAHAAECAGQQGKFWPMHDKLFEDTRALEERDLLGHARALQLSMKKFKKCIDDKPYESRISSDEKTAANFGARGTPAFFINGRYLPGAQPYDRFSALVDQELAKAKKSGVPRSQFYEKVIIGKGRKNL